MYSGRILMLAFLALSGDILAEVVEFSSCSEVTACQIHEVRVEPCKEAADNRPCKIKRGKSASISFDFTPEFEGTELSTNVYWENGLVDLPFPGMATNACLSTQCPVTKSQKQTFTYALNVNKKSPARTYPLKWKLWNDKEELCCFRFEINLTK